MSTALLFALLKSQHIRDVDHALAMSMLRLSPETPGLVCVAAALVSRAHSLGHSCLPLDKFQQLLGQSSSLAAPALPEGEEFRAALNSSDWCSDGRQEQSILVLDGDAIALQRYWNYENRLANALRQRLGASEQAISPQLQAYWSTLFSGDVDSAQAVAAKRACETNFFLLTGGPGTGKTATISRLLRLLQYQARENAQPLRIGLAAPTGKASTRLSEALRAVAGAPADEALEAKTLHRLLGSKPDSVQFRHDADNPLPLDVLVVDEASMIDLPLMCKLLEALPIRARLILVGDPDQLPSVETGNVLRACCDAIAADLANTPHRVHLDRVYRQSADSDIGLAAQTVLAGDSDDFIDKLRQNAYRAMHWHSGDGLAMEKIIHAAALSHYRRIQQAESLEHALALSKQFRILCAARESGAGSVAINRYIADRLGRNNGEVWYAGRLCLVTENTVREQLFNGDIGLCWPDEQGIMRIWVETASGLKAWHPANFPAHEDAYAITVHKAQGSEFDRILLVLPDAGHRVLSRELLYTGLTRARSGVELWAGAGSIAAAMARQNRRWSRLAERLSFNFP